MDPSIDDSDVSMPVETDDEDDDFYGSSPKENDSQGQSAEAETEVEGSKKRKFSTSSETPNGQLEREVEDRKRQRSSGNMQVQGTSSPRDKSLLPAEIWHHIFTFCPPRVLGVLLRVNQAFNAYLDPSSSDISVNPLPRSSVKLLCADTIWAASRRLFPLPGMQTMPAPLLGKSELQMWKIVCGSLCQFCSKRGKVTALMDKWHPGPGENGVSPILSLGIRSCGACLQQNSTKEIDLLLSSSIPSPLMAALPFVFLTNELHAIYSTTLQTGQQPPSIQITKHYYNPQIEEIKQEFEDVKALGSATAEEWLKGLDGRGKELRDDAARWERWEAAGGLSKMRESRTDGTHKNTISTSAIPNFTPSFNGSSSTTYNGISSLPQPLHVLTNTASPLPQSLHNNFATKPPLRFDSPQQSGFSFPPRPHPQAKHERTKEEVAELKAARRAEIERRCRLLNPPIEAGVLAHMASFQAAIQIIQPLTDSAWEVLKPRLLSQREEAEQRENDRIAQTRVQERFDERRFQDLQTKGDPKDLVDKEWEDIQAPLRARIGGYADEIIRDGWNNGEKVSPDTSPLFAAEVLIYVRKRFYAEIAKDEAAIRATGREPDVDPPNGPYTRRLTLENMKWVFDTKVKPHTEQYRKELFLCNACDHASKYYGFEGVIQHFAAKHTSALSSGSVVVHWKSEWPEYPPFNPDPAAASVSSYYPAAPGASAPYAVSNGQGVVPNYGYGGYQAAPLPAPMQTPNPHGYQESPGPYYGHPQFGDQYSGHQNGPYAPPPPQTYPDTSQAYHTPQYSLAPPNSNISGYHGILHDYSQQNFDGQYQSQSQSMYTSPHNRITYPATVPEASAQQAVYTHQAGQYSNNYIQPSSYAASNFPQVPQRSGEYTAQLLDLARNAREIWNSIGGLKEVPGSVKVYTIIYHILARFRSTYQDDPPFSMLVEGLSNNKDMRPVRNVNGLLCKACSLGMAGSSSAPQKKHFSFPQLVNHFHTLHYQELSQPNAGYLPDWKTDMVLLPDISKLTSIVHATGMDDKKLRFFTEALPEIVAAPEPSVHNYHNGSSHYLGGAPDSNEYSHLAPSQDNHEKYYTTADSGKPSETGSVTYDPGEYDPRHPAELPIVTQPQQKISRQREQQPDPSHNQASWQYSRHEDQAYRESYQDRLSRTYVEHSPARAIPVDDYGHALPEARRIYVDEPVRYREAGDIVEYRVRREPRIIEYQEPERMPSSYRLANDQSYRNNSAEVASGATSTYPLREQYARETNSTQQNRIYEVVAQISQQAQQARERVSAKLEAGGAGSEDGEVTAESASKPDLSRKPPSEEASNAAERFLNEFHPGEVANDPIPQETSNGSRRAWEADRPDSTHVHRPPMDSHLRGAREVYEENERVFNKDRRASPVIHDGMLNGYERAPPPLRDYAHNERYAGSAEGQPIHRDRSPELVDRRYKVNNVVYRDERQGSHGMHRTPSSRYARYESVRLENDRARSRSPQVYVKIGPHSGQYRERSPVAHPLRQESAYSTRTPLQHEEDAFERPRRQEYTRVYVEESRPRETRYAEEYELIRVSDPNGDYMIRRPVRREVEREPVYADYEDDVYARPPIYENRAPVARAEPAFVEEEYDPRQPGAVPVPVARYQ